MPTDQPSSLPPPQARTPDDEVCKTCGRPTKITITSQGICVGSCSDCEQPFVNYGSPAPLKPTTCLLCNWEWDQEKNTHIPEIEEPISGVYICGECYTRARTVESFGLTVEELRKAATKFKAASAPQEAGWISVEERLPVIGTEVIAWKPDLGCLVITYSNRSHEHRTLIRRDGQWWDSGRRITHWMPLPKFPTDAASERGVPLEETEKCR